MNKKRAHIICLAWALAAIPINVFAFVTSPKFVLPIQNVILVSSSQGVAMELRQAMDLQAAGNLVGAEQIARQALGDAATLRSKRDFSVAAVQSILGSILRDEGKFAEAEPMLRQSLATTEAIYGIGHFSTISTLGALGGLYLRQGRYDEALGAYEQASRIAVGKYGENSFEAAEMLNSLAAVQATMGNSQDAAATFQRVLATAKKGGSQTLDLAAGAANNLAVVLQQAGRNDAALAAYHDAYSSNVAMFGPDSPAAMLNLANAGVLLRDMGNLPEAERMLSTVLAFRERVLGDDHPETAQLQNDMGWLELAKKTPQDALPHFQKSVAFYQRLHSLQSHGIRAQGAGISEREVGRSILGLLRTVSQLQAQNSDRFAALLDEGFEAAQSLHTSAAADSLTRAGARLASGGGALGDIVRQGQDLAVQWQNIDATLTKALSSPANQRNPAFEQQARAQLDAVGAKIDGIDAQVAQQFPAYFNLTHPQPLSVSDVQALLDTNEALVLISAFGGNNGNGTFVWVITKKDAKSVATEMGIDALGDMIWTLRCGVDTDASSTDAGSAYCKSRGVDILPSGLPRFSAKTAYNLYHALFGGLENVIAGKSLLIVAPDPLAAIPFQILVSKPPAHDFPETQSDFRDVEWLGRDSAISVLPSVTALRVMRGQGQRDHASELYVGIGDPTLAGNRGCPDAEAATNCPAPTVVASVKAAMVKRSVTGVGTLFKNGTVDVDAVRSLCPLPDTATELRCVASSIGADPSSVHIGENATLATLRELDLERFRVIHFATHGLVAGDLTSADGTLGEPALVLTPPATATADDNGLLKESDIVNLKLNADWVILSACNTAAGQNSGGEALSGLSSAFLYAGARALLASHWSVSSDAAVRLTTAAMLELSKDPTIGRAEALRRSIVQILDHGGTSDAHPLIWAPFSVIGEGGNGHL